jgi:hypothetical protein
VIGAAMLNTWRTMEPCVRSFMPYPLAYVRPKMAGHCTSRGNAAAACSQ